MRFTNWAQTFKEKPTCEDIPGKVQKTEILYWIWLFISIGIMIWGIVAITIAPANNLKSHLFGLFLAIDGVICIAVIKIWVHIRLAMYYTIWDRENRLKAEINKSEAQDL